MNARAVGAEVKCCVPNAAALRVRYMYCCVESRKKKYVLYMYVFKLLAGWHTYTYILHVLRSSLALLSRCLGQLNTSIASNKAQSTFSKFQTLALHIPYSSSDNHAPGSPVV